MFNRVYGREFSSTTKVKLENSKTNMNIVFGGGIPFSSINKLAYIRKFCELFEVTPLIETPEFEFLSEGKSLLTKVGKNRSVDKYEDLGGSVQITAENKKLSEGHGVDTYDEILAFRSEHSELGRVYDRSILEYHESGRTVKFMVVKTGDTRLVTIDSDGYIELKESFKLVELKNFETLKLSLAKFNQEIEKQKGWVDGIDICSGFPYGHFKGKWSMYKHYHQSLSEDGSVQEIEDHTNWNVKTIKDENGNYAYALNDKDEQKIDIINTMFVGHHLIKDSEYSRRSMDYHTYNIKESLGFIKVVDPQEIQIYALKKMGEAELKAIEEKRQKELAKKRVLGFSKTESVISKVDPSIYHKNGGFPRDGVFV